MRSRNWVSRLASPANSTLATSAAAPNPTIPATFSVAERKPRSWPPPKTMGDNFTPLANIQGAHSLGAVQLMCRQREQVNVESIHVERYLPCRLHCVAYEIERRAVLVRRASSSIGCRVPTTLFAAMIATSVTSRLQRRQPGFADRPTRVQSTASTRYSRS